MKSITIAIHGVLVVIAATLTLTGVLPEAAPGFWLWIVAGCVFGPVYVACYVAWHYLQVRRRHHQDTGSDGPDG